MSEAPSTPAGSTAIKTDEDKRALTCKVFRQGKPEDQPRNMAEISEILRDEGCLVWLDVIDPQSQDLDLLQKKFNLHPLAVEDAVEAH